ncbi:LysR family transcriptional regulator [Streptomyces viridiviolaceus]|uniref:LysR substrate-binding domain-containing protein n=1 Tax=Streptomyces viridiviolaceus TaxID=68282 RepID=A0ABW2DUQ7_9ACTN|nr:LysR family transcriptional regulator [Streptomyces viridiviolaceus]GHB58302.1 LysR family transcriptional regulator [Streptomyces viridiviolaceus]
MGTFDLNLARVFVLLYETGSVTATAETLHVTQPTVSYSLAKLRRHFDDELFRRTGRGLTPTAGALRLYEPLQRALAEIDGTVRQADDFDPETMSGRFTIALSDLGEATLLPRLLAAARERAPGVSFTVRPFDVEEAESQLRRGDLDAFVATPVLTSHRTVRIPLFGERYVGMVAADHPRVRGDAVTLPELAAEHHATVFGPSGHVAPRAVLAAHGLLERVAVDATRFSMLPYLLEQTDLIAIVPEYVGEVFTASHRVRLVRLPFETEPIEVALYARHESSRSPAQRWLVRFMAEVLGEQVSPAQLPPSTAR